MNRLSCDEAQARLSALLAGDEAGGEDLEAHLAECGDCRTLADAWFRQDRALNEWAAADRQERLRARIHEALLKESGPADAARRKPSSRRRLPGRRRIRRPARWPLSIALAVAAAVLMVAGVFLLFFDNRPAPRVADPEPDANPAPPTGDPDATKAGPRIAHVACIAAVQGEVEAQSGEAETWRVVGAGTPVGVGGSLRTKETRATVVYESGTVMHVNQFTTLTFVKREDAHAVSLTAGEVFVETSKPDAGFTVVTPHGHALDLGTRFGVKTDRAGTTIVVVDGKVTAVTDAGSVGLSEQQEVRLASRAVPPGVVAFARDLFASLAWTQWNPNHRPTRPGLAATLRDLTAGLIWKDGKVVHKKGGWVGTALRPEYGRARTWGDGQWDYRAEPFQEKQEDPKSTRLSIGMESLLKAQKLGQAVWTQSRVSQRALTENPSPTSNCLVPIEAVKEVDVEGRVSLLVEASVSVLDVTPEKAPGQGAWGFGLLVGTGKRTYVFRTIQNTRQQRPGLQIHQVEPAEVEAAHVPLVHEPQGVYWVKLVAFPSGGQTVLGGKIWRAGETEPRWWQLEACVPGGPVDAIGMTTTRCACRFELGAAMRTRSRTR